MPALIEPRILKGFRDFLPPAEIRRRELIRLLEKAFQDFGFVPIDTPALEYTEVLLGKGGGETDKQVYAFQDQGGRNVALRFDLTVPFARFLAAHREELYLPFKRYHIAKVWRGENTQRGRYREFTQCDFDIVGSDCPGADFEILLLMASGLELLGIGDFHIHLSHRGLFNGLVRGLGLGEKTGEILRAVDKLGKTGPAEVLGVLSGLAGEGAARQILDFTLPEDSNQATWEKIQAACAGFPEAQDGLKRLAEVLRLAGETGLAPRLTLNPSITRGLDYYDGLVYETFLDSLPRIGSVCSGGRYNNLAGLYSPEALPGVGASIGLDRLL
ncbi:MAG: histidine--tRNA ligase, partial [Spirochaetales bacterium]|nr:histidine--tRNA ligase [Spirochaetales bacterium]